MGTCFNFFLLVQYFSLTSFQTIIPFFFTGNVRIAEAFGLAVLLGALAPMSAALATYTGLERLERRVVVTYVEPDDAPASTALQRWRGLAWLHDWPQLAAIQRRGFGQGDGPGVRAGRTWTDLTGQPEHRLNPSFD